MQAAFCHPNRITEPDARHDYGEERFWLMGMIEGKVFVVVYTLRSSVIRIISARKANLRPCRMRPSTRGALIKQSPSIPFSGSP